MLNSAIRIATVLGVVLCNPIASAQTDRFALFAECSKVYFWKAGLTKESSNLGLSRSEVQRAIESRLRAARIYQGARGLGVYDMRDARIPILQASVYVLDSAFRIDIVFLKLLHDQFSGTQKYAVSWETNTFGTHGNNPAFILSSISSLMDDFINEYLRVNGDDC